ncbi:MAG: hypothetical protein GY755_12545 [Chloroflexi bacterium]|nr:hypothetical protein [Chloroflexota bacterium]
MNHKLMFTLNAIVALIFGFAFLLVPVLVLEMFGVETYVATVLFGRFFGVAMVALGLLLWFTKDIPDESMQKWMGISMFISAFLGLIVTVLGISPASGVIRANGWVIILTYLFFTLGYAYLIFMKPKMKE